MKIISKFKDYYDGLASYDAATGVYERTTKEIPVEWIGYGHSIIGHKRSYELTTGLIGFCGKLYPFVQYHDSKYNKEFEPRHKVFLYSFEDFEAVRDDVKDVKASRYRWFGGSDDLFKTWHGLDSAKFWFKQDFQTLIDNVPKWKSSKTGKSIEYVNPKDIFLDYKVPYFALIKADREEHTARGWQPAYDIVLNPCLTDYQFYRIFDAYTAYQEIEMFMNNQIVRPDDPYIEPVSDKLKAESHGFNAESFRSSKGKKR